ncbi:hypothetical protein JW916_16315 [Candidatus Sumerlaeota bacterium]|nr:hypothetical protein [Candidatus Sumerlaeota bacterium]
MRFGIRRTFLLSILFLGLAAGGSAQPPDWLPIGSGGAPDEPLRVSLGAKSPGKSQEFLVSAPGAQAKQVAAPDGQSYTQLSVFGGGFAAEAFGRPAMPFRGFFVEIPHGVDVSVEILEQGAQSLGTGHRVYPLQPPQPDVSDAAEPMFEIDNTAYETDAFFPAEPVQIDAPAILRGRRVVFVKAFPLQYNPATTELRAAAPLRFALRFEGEVDTDRENRKALLATPQFEALASELLVNYEPVDKEDVARAMSARHSAQAAPGLAAPGVGAPELATGDGADYLVIAADALMEEVLPLGEWKHRKGSRTRLVGMSTVGSTYLDVANYIQTAYTTWTPAPEFVLLVGDQADVPGYDIVGHPYHGSSHHWPSDNPYACLDGGDYLPDLIIGRLAVHTEAQATTVVNKILTYDRTPDLGDWYDDYLVAAYLQDDGNDHVADRWFMETAMTAAQFMVDEKGYTRHSALCTNSGSAASYHFRASSYTHRSTINQIRWGVSPYPDPIPSWIVSLWTSASQATSDVSTAVNGGVGIVQHRDHGGETGWGEPSYYVSHVNALTNGVKTPVVLSMNCLTGAFDYGSDCFAEAWQKHTNGGAVGIVAATRVSYSGCNDLLTHGIYDCYYPEYDSSHSSHAVGSYGNSDRPAVALAYGKCYMYTYDSSSYSELTCDLFQWFGDPEMPLRTRTPEALVVGHPAFVAYNQPVDVTVTVSMGGSPLQGARATVSHPTVEGDYWTGLTDATGTIVFSGIVFTERDDYDLVVTEQNATPYEGTICASVSSDGVVLLDKEFYSGSDRIGVFLGDQDLESSATCDVTLTSDSGDTETLTLTESVPATGMFTGTLATTTTSGTIEDGWLQVAHGTTITVTYADADTGSGVPETKIDTAAADCQPPVISNVQVLSALDVTASIGFDTDEPTTGRLRCGTAAGGPYTILESDPAFGTTHLFDLSGLTPTTTYYFDVAAGDAVGYATSDDNGGACYSFTTSAGPLDRYAVSTVSSPQYQDIAFDLTLTAQDAWDNTLTGLNGEVTIEGRIGTGTLSSIAIADCNPNTPDSIEIQNVSGGTIDTSGWVVAISDEYTDINAVNAVYWSLPASMTAGEILYRTDETTNYWGSNMYWSSGNNGWAMIVDDEGNVVDFVAWGWTESSIASMNTTVNGHNVVIGSGWSGNGVSSSGSLSMQRQGSEDTDTASDFAWLDNTLGTQSAGLTVPFTDGFTPVAVAPTSATLSSGVWTGPLTVLETADDMYLRVSDTSGCVGISNLFDVNPGVPLTVVVPTDATEGDGVLAGAGRVEVAAAPTSDLDVTLTSNDVSEATVPTTVTIAAGTTSTTLDLTIVDDALLDGSRTVEISALAGGPYVGQSATLVVHDNETATLSVSLPADATEGDGTLSGVGTVQASSAVEDDVTVSLSSDDPSEATVGASVVVLSGQDSATFDLTVVDDGAIDGTQVATIAASVTNWTSGNDTIQILDNEDNSLVLSLPLGADEGDGTIQGSVSVSGTLGTDLIVTLSSSDTGAATVPTTATIPAGSVSTVFDITIPDDLLFDGVQVTSITASAAGFVPDSDLLSVEDNDLHHFGWAPIGSPQTAGVGFTATLTAQTIDDYPIAGFAGSATLTAAGDGGAQAVDPDTLAFTNGLWTGSLTLYGADTNVSIAPSATTAAGAIAANASDTFDVTANALYTYAFDAIASPQYRDYAFGATLTARDAWGNVLTGLNGDVAIEGRIGAGTASSIVIAECGDDTPDFVEIQNVSDATIDTSGWIVALNNAESSNINSVHSVVWHLPESMAPGEILYRTDDAAKNYWGSNIWWGSATSVGWAMIVDDMGEIVDFVAWGYSAAQIATLNVTLGVENITVGSAWSGDGLPYYTSDSATAQRQGASDNDDATDWTWESNTLGTQSAGLTVPFTGGPTLVAIAPTNVTLADGVWTGPATVLETAEAMYLHASDTSGYTGESNLFDVGPGIPLAVIVPAGATEGNGVLTGAGRVEVAAPPASDLDVTLTSSDLSEATVPTTATIAAGTTSTTLDVAILDDALLDGSQAVEISASVLGPYLPQPATLFVHDNETATLSVSLPADATEGDGTLPGVGKIEVSSTVEADVSVSLTSNDVSEVTAPTSVTVLSGHDAAFFDLTVVDDAVIDGTQVATITASVTNWTSGTETIQVLDNEDNALALSLPSDVNEGDGVVQGGVSISGAVETDLTVTLSSSDPGVAAVSASTTIPAGSVSSAFDITIPDDLLFDGAQTANLTANAAGFVPDTQSLTVQDNDLHHFGWTLVSSPQTAGVGFTATLTAETIDDHPIPSFAGSATLTAAGDGGALARISHSRGCIRPRSVV